MRRWKLSAAAVLFSMSAGLATIHAAGRDPYVGEYSMECPQAQCWLEIEKGKGRPTTSASLPPTAWMPPKSSVGRISRWKGDL